MVIEPVLENVCSPATLMTVGNVVKSESIVDPVTPMDNGFDDLVILVPVTRPTEN